MRVVQWIVRGMVFLGSILMVYNVCGFIRFARYVKGLKSWGQGNALLNLPIVLLVCFLLGYLAVGFIGKPDLIVAGILFGGSIFVFVMYKLLSGITQRIIQSERLEAELLAAEESNRAKTSFLASMSHEMRTPLNAILGLDTLVLQDESLKPQTRDRVQKVDVSARHLLELINDVLDMNRIESQEIEIQAEPFSLWKTLDLLNVLTRTQCDEKGIRFESERAEGVPERCVGDDHRLRQALLNILGNAVKFTPAGGTVRFKAEAADGDAVRFTITDTGIGIDREFLSRLFDSFAREDASTTNRFGGSGLGLAITHKLVKLMGGDIAVRSEKGEGSAFVVTIPLPPCPDAPEGAEPPGEAAGVSLAGRHILIVEDVDLNAEMLTDLLELEDITSERAENGRVAVDLFEKYPPGHFDAILMDLRMPVMDGIEATRTIRALDRPDAGTIPILALTANAFEDDVRRSLEAGMNVHLSKPADSDLLYESLKKLLDGATGAKPQDLANRRNDL